MGKNFFSICITGGIACGKSEVGRIFESMGIPVCDSDLVAHQLMLPESPVYSAIVEFFGERILNEDKTINRIVLGGIVFSDENALKKLNSLIHPAVRSSIEHWIRAQSGLCAVMIPLLFEVGWEDLCDTTICVASSEEKMVERIICRGFSEAESQARIRSQMAVNEKISKSDYVIWNDGTFADLRGTADEIVNRIKCERMQ